MTEIETSVDNDGLREIAEGYIRFSIKAKDTEDNKAIHDGFKAYCEAECDNNYTQGIRNLLKNYENDFKFQALYELAEYLKTEVAILKREIEELKKKPQVEEDKGAAF